MRKESPDLLCARLASAQHGVITRQQALEAGLSKSAIYRRTICGEWALIYPGVYRLASVPKSWEQELMGACLWMGKGAVVSHQSAAAVLRLDGFRPGPLEFSSPRKIKPRAGLLMHRSDRWLQHDVTAVDGIPVTSPTRTLLDLGAVAGSDLVDLALEDALRKRLTSLPRLRWEIRQIGGRGRRGTLILRELLEQRGSGQAHSESALEVQLLQLIRKASLPLPVSQYEVKVAGKLIARLDFAYPGALLAVEADGYRYHSGHGAWQKDRARQNALMDAGWRVLHVTSEDLRVQPQRVVRAVRRALGLEV